MLQYYSMKVGGGGKVPRILENVNTLRWLGSLTTRDYYS